MILQIHSPDGIFLLQWKINNKMQRLTLRAFKKLLQFY